MGEFKDRALGIPTFKWQTVINDIKQSALSLTQDKGEHASSNISNYST